MLTPASTWNGHRRFVGGVAAAFVALAATPFVATLLAGGDAPRHAVATTVAVLAAVALGAIGLPGRRALALAATAGMSGALVLLALGDGAAALVVPIVATGAVAAGARVGGRTRPLLAHAVAHRRRLALGWALLALLSVVQTARLATYIHDPRTEFVVATRNPFWYGHQCLPAYLHGAELAARGDANLYHSHHWPGLDAAAAPESAIEGLRVEDPYQYPPQFLLLPRLALGVTMDLDLLRTGWFAIQMALFAGVFAGLALWVGGKAGQLALWLLPGVLLAFPLTFNFQFGQFHLAAVCLAVLAMLLFARGRRAAGGALLAFAIVAKVFPLVLLPYLALRRRWRELGWTAAIGAVLTALALAVLGTAPFAAFFDYHLPRLGSGEAFAFDLAWPEVAELVIADNQGAYGLARKLGLERGTAASVGRLFGIAVLALAALAGWRLRGAARWAHGASWLALLGLGSMASPGAWGDYVPSTAVWLLALLAPLAGATRGWRWLLGASVPFQMFLLGTFPLGTLDVATVLTPVSLVGVLLLLALYGAVFVRLSALGAVVRRDGAVAPSVPVRRVA